jgi:hypothetical protein
MTRSAECSELLRSAGCARTRWSCSSAINGGQRSAKFAVKWTCPRARFRPTTVHTGTARKHCTKGHARCRDCQLAKSDPAGFHRGPADPHRGQREKLAPESELLAIAVSSAAPQPRTFRLLTTRRTPSTCRETSVARCFIARAIHGAFQLHDALTRVDIDLRRGP